MPFPSTGSLTSTHANNMLRGYYRDNSDHAVTGTTDPTDLASVTITGGDIGATGFLSIVAAGTSSGTAGVKTLTPYFGGIALPAIAITTAANHWTFECQIYNTNSSAQRIMFRWSEWNGSTSALVEDSGNYTSTSVDTSSNQILKFTGTLTNGGDTITQRIFNVLVCQIT